jgi:hypothetical protein
MAPEKALPYCDEFASAEEYIESLLSFATSSTLFQTLCGGVHILDFFTQTPSLYDTVLPAPWRDYLMDIPTMSLLDLLIRLDLTDLTSLPRELQTPPESLLEYIKNIRRHSLNRGYKPRPLNQKTLPRHVAVGMVPKKIHEVANFADYVDSLAADMSSRTGRELTHFVDFGSGQNYLGRTLALPPYNRHIIAVEGREINIEGSKRMDITANLAEREVVMRNKKLYVKQLVEKEEVPEDKRNKAYRKAVAEPMPENDEAKGDFRPYNEIKATYKTGEGVGSVQYVQALLNDGDLSEVVPQIEDVDAEEEEELVQEFDNHCISEANGANGACCNGNGATTKHTNGTKSQPKSLMTISIHSCGNLSHHGIRSLLLNPSVHSIAIVGCCYNLLTERLGPPTYKNPILRPNLRPINARVAREQDAFDQHGYPMSEKVATYGGDGIRLNITARMMAVQAPSNWTEKESDAFFTRHYYRALLQKVFLDRGVVNTSTPAHVPRSEAEAAEQAAAGLTTEPVIIGSLPKRCYCCFLHYVRGAVAKISRGTSSKAEEVAEKMGGMTDDEIKAYSAEYGSRKKELSVMWSLMAFSAGVVESLIVSDRWLWLKEQEEVSEAWVETVFDYKLSPRNLVVVGIKR